MTIGVQLFYDTGASKHDPASYKLRIYAAAGEPTGRLQNCGMLNNVTEYRGSFADNEAARAALVEYLADTRVNLAALIPSPTPGRPVGMF